MLQDLRDTPLADRRSRILDAAERCFVRSGFHRTTMQDVAAEAGMSPGNLYRYFPSKDAIVAGLTERDRSQVAQDFDAFDTNDFMASFARLGRKHFQDEPREKAVLCLEIWAESARNPASAAMCAGLEQEVIRRLAEVLREGQARGDIAATVDPQATAVAIMTIGNGLFVRRAIAPDFDPGREVDVAIALIGAMLRGAVPFERAALAEETAS